MKARGILCAILLCSLLPLAVWSAPASADGSQGDSPPPWARRPRAETLATVTVGFSASYTPYGFPRTDEHINTILNELRKTHPGTDLGEMGSGLGVLGYVQVLIWEGLGLRLSLQHVKAQPPEGFGVVRGDVDAETSPVNLSYSLVKEIPMYPVRFVVGVGIDQYRWSMDWQFAEIGEDPLEEHHRHARVLRGGREPPRFAAHCRRLIPQRGLRDDSPGHPSDHAAGSLSQALRRRR